MKNILILDDNKDSREGLRRIIEYNFKNVSIYVAPNSEIAIDYSMRNNIDIFLIDIRLEGDSMSGVDFAKLMRGHEKYNDTYVIFVTSLVELEHYVINSVRCYGYIYKPIDPREIIRTIEVLLSKADIAPTPVRRAAMFRYDGIVYPISVSDIVYLNVRNRVLTIYTLNDEFKFPYMTLGKALQEINDPSVVQCHKSFAVNTMHIENIDYANSIIKMKGYSDQIDIGRQHKKNLNL